MSLTVTRVLQDPAHFSPANNCFFHDSAVACLLEGDYRYLRWEGQKAVSSDPDLTDSQSRIFGSSDQGLTWGLLAQFLVPDKTQWNALFSPNGTRLLAGILDKGGYAYDASYSVLPRSEDGGLTWTSTVDASVFNTIGATSCQTQRFVKLPGTTTVLAFGRYDVTGGPFNVMRSTDDGVTFAPFADVGVFRVDDATALSATVVVCVSLGNGFYSTDAGATWTASVDLPLFSDLLGPFVSMGSGVVLSFGRTTSSNLGAIWRSTDGGQTYTLFSLIGGSVNGERTLRLLSPTVLIAGSGGPSPTVLQHWWLSEDAGVTWTVAALVGDQAADSDSVSMIITNTGIMLAALDRPTRATAASDNKGEIWRGVVDGFSTTVGTCEALDSVGPPVGAGVMGVHLECIPVFSPTPCPPVCPDDPVQSVGVLVIPGGGGMPVIPVALSMRLACTPTFSMGLCAPRYPTDPVQPAGQLVLPGSVGPVLPGGAWRSVMTLLGLVNAPAVIPGPTGALGGLATCGATFANNNCAVAGC